MLRDYRDLFKLQDQNASTSGFSPLVLELAQSWHPFLMRMAQWKACIEHAQTVEYVCRKCVLWFPLIQEPSDPEQGDEDEDEQENLNTGAEGVEGAAEGEDAIQ